MTPVPQQEMFRVMQQWGTQTVAWALSLRMIDQGGRPETQDPQKMRAEQHAETNRLWQQAAALPIAEDQKPLAFARLVLHWCAGIVRPAE